VSDRYVHAWMTLPLAAMCDQCHAISAAVQKSVLYDWFSILLHTSLWLHLWVLA
jgi:hypothetical protein